MTPGRVVCLGEGLVDMICEQPVESPGDATEFEPHLGGSLANMAVAAARFGADTRMVGGAGDDAWGHWVRDGLAAAGVGTDAFRLVAGGATSLAFVTVGPDGEPAFDFHAGPADRRAVSGSGDDIERELEEGTGVLVVGSDSLLEPGERAVTMAAAERARERGRIVLCDPNLRPARWPGAPEMLAAVSELARRASVVKCNAEEAVALTGAGDDRAAAKLLLAAGADAVVVTRGPAGALLARREAEPVEVPAEPAGRPVDATGAGDCVAGVLAAALAVAGGTAALERALPVAMRAAARVIGAWGATDGLPAPEEAARWLAAASLDNN